MIYTLQHRDDYEPTEFKMTIAKQECRVKCNTNTLTAEMDLFISSLYREALDRKDGLGITCTVRTKMRSMFCDYFPFYTKPNSKWKELFRVIRGDKYGS